MKKLFNFFIQQFGFKTNELKWRKQVEYKAGWNWDWSPVEFMNMEQSWPETNN